MGTIAALGWRVYTWQHSQRTHIRVKGANTLPTYQDGTVGEWCFSIEAINRGRDSVRVTSAGVRLPDGGDVVIVNPPFPGALPTDVPPRDSRQTWIEVHELEARGVDVHQPMVGFVRTATDERFESSPAVLWGAE